MRTNRCFLSAVVQLALIGSSVGDLLNLDGERPYRLAAKPTELVSVLEGNSVDSSLIECGILHLTPRDKAGLNALIELQNQVNVHKGIVSGVLYPFSPQIALRLSWSERNAFVESLMLGGLSAVGVGDGELGDDAIQHVLELEQLACLDLRGTRITAGGLQTLSAMPSLVALVLPMAADDSWIDAINRIESLREISFAYTQVSALGLSRLARKPELRVLNCSHLANPRGLCETLNGFVNLETLLLDGVLLSDEDVADLKLPLLRELSMNQYGIGERTNLKLLSEKLEVLRIDKVTEWGQLQGFGSLQRLIIVGSTKNK